MESPREFDSTETCTENTGTRATLPSSDEGGKPDRKRRSRAGSSPRSKSNTGKTSKPASVHQLSKRSVKRPRKPKAVRTLSDSKSQPLQVHTIQPEDLLVHQIPPLVWKYRWVIVEPQVLRTSHAWDTNYDRCLSDGHAHLRPRTNEVVNIEMVLAPDVAEGEADNLETLLKKAEIGNRWTLNSRRQKTRNGLF